MRSLQSASLYSSFTCRPFSRRRLLTVCAATAAAAAVGAVSAGAALADAAPGNSVSGVLDGNSGGSFARYLISDPTGEPVTITLSYAPFDAGHAHRVGFSVWQNGKRLHKATGQATGYKDHVNSSSPQGTVTPSASGGPVLIKVFNYSPATISYSLTLRGASVVAAPSAAPRIAAPVALTAPAAGTLVGEPGGAYATYEVASTEKPVTITMVYSPFDAGQAHRVGFSVWQGKKRLLRETGQATGYKDHTNSNSPTATLKPTASGGPVLIKVFNFSTDTISFTLTVA